MCYVQVFQGNFRLNKMLELKSATATNYMDEIVPIKGTYERQVPKTWELTSEDKQLSAKHGSMFQTKQRRSLFLRLSRLIQWPDELEELTNSNKITCEESTYLASKTRAFQEKHKNEDWAPSIKSLHKPMNSEPENYFSQTPQAIRKGAKTRRSPRRWVKWPRRRWSQCSQVLGNGVTIRA